MATTVPTAELLPTQVAYEAPEHVRQAFASMGRTEDVRISPSGCRLAFACYAREEIAVADVEFHRDSTGLKIAVEDIAFHRSASLSDPHGLDFVDDRLLVVANRGGVLEVLRLPGRGQSGDAKSVASSRCALGATGSVAVRRETNGEHEILAVHNWANAITRYRLTQDGSIAGGDVLVHRWLDLPDGIAMSSDQRWLAVSNHNTHDVLVFDTATLHRDADPVGILRGVGYPHGLRFTLGDSLLVVADAGAPYVDVFERTGESWAGTSYPAVSIRVLDDATFSAGNHNPQEGGPKGIDVDTSRNVLVVTSEHAPLTFFDLEQAVEAAGQRAPEHFVQYELDRLDDLARSKAETAEVRDQLRAVLSTKAWRLMKPLRRLSGALRRTGRP